MNDDAIGPGDSDTRHDALFRRTDDGVKLVLRDMVRNGWAQARGDMRGRKWNEVGLCITSAGLREWFNRLIVQEKRVTRRPQTRDETFTTLLDALAENYLPAEQYHRIHVAIEDTGELRNLFDDIVGNRFIMHGWSGK